MSSRPQAHQRRYSLPKRVTAIFTAGALSGLVCLLSACATNTFTRQQALADLEFIKETLADNHPAFALASGNLTTHWAQTGFERAAAMLDEGATPATALRYYVAGFADSHLSVNLDSGAAPEWAGIQIHHDGHYYQVVHTAPEWATELPQVGSQLMGCDGRPVDSIMRSEILPLKIHNYSDLFPKVWYAGDLLINRGYLRESRPAKCKFRYHEANREIELSWRPLEHGELLKGETIMKLSPYRITEIAPAVHWLSLPSFATYSFPGTTLRKLSRQLAALDGSATIVFDLRGNTGGNSMPGLELARALYGADYLWGRLRAAPATPMAWWRVSEGNLRYLRTQLLRSLRAAGEHRALLGHAQELAAAMQTALNDGRDLLLQPELEVAKVSPGDAARGIPARRPLVYLLTDAYCVSACQDFMEIMLLNPDAIHIGQATGAETAFTDVRSVALPSGMGLLTFPQKMYSDRPRDRAAVMEPHIPARHSLMDTEALQQWVISMVPKRH